MGWVSYLEDITERLTRDLEEYQGLASDHALPSAELRVRVQSLLDACGRALAEMQQHLELATDPAFDMAYEISELDKDKAELEREVSVLHRRRADLMGEIQRLLSEGKDLKLEVRTLKRTVALNEQELNRILADNPELAYDLYSPTPQDEA